MFPKHWPPVSFFRWWDPRSGEIQFVVDNPMSFFRNNRACSPKLAVGNFTFKVLVFRKGCPAGDGNHLGAFILAEPGSVEPDAKFKGVKFEITLINWKNFSKSKVSSDSFNFKASGVDIDRGFKNLLAISLMKDIDSE